MAVLAYSCSAQEPSPASAVPATWTSVLPAQCLAESGVHWCTLHSCTALGARARAPRGVYTTTQRSAAWQASPCSNVSNRKIRTIKKKGRSLLSVSDDSSPMATKPRAMAALLFIYPLAAAAAPPSGHSQPKVPTPFWGTEHLPVALHAANETGKSWAVLPLHFAHTGWNSNTASLLRTHSRMQRFAPDDGSRPSARDVLRRGDPAVGPV